MNHAGQDNLVEKQIQETVDRLRPALQIEGGDVQLLSIDDQGVVRLRLAGSCADCPSVAASLRTALQWQLMTTFPQITQVLCV